MKNRGFNLTVNNSGTGIPGPAGANGATAYQIAVINGFVGTEAEWLLSLKGTNGTDGINGTNGIDGYTPIKGIDYFDGLQGPQGPPGYTPIKNVDYFDGAQGPIGPQGIQGVPGYTPIKGVDYFDGATGPKGDTGAQGIRGFRGDKGDTGPAGVNGINGVGVPTGGTSGQILSKIDATDYNTQWIDAPSGGVVGTTITLPATTNPNAPSADNVTIFGREIANRAMPAFIGPSGLDSALQPLLARNKIGYWNPQGNATTVPGVFGFTAPTTVGTVTARNVDTTNVLTRMRRIGYVSSRIIAGALASWRVAVAQYTTGTGTGLGGFMWVTRFGVSDEAAVSGARMFVGMSSNTEAATNVEPSTLTNSFGIAQLSTDNTQWYFVYGGSSAQTPIALGTSLGAPTLNSTAYELALFAPPSVSGTVYYQVTNIGTGVSVSGTISGTSTQVPQSTTLLTTQIWRTNNAKALAVGIDVCSCYIETDQ